MSLKRKAEEGALSDAKKTKSNGNIRSFFAPPALKSETMGSQDVKFDKQKWAEKLTDEQRDLLKLEIDTLHESWLAHLKDEITSKEFLDLKRFLKKELESGKKIFPPMQDIYSWFASPPSIPKTRDLLLTE
jgi:uracil-DNA glycosylase